MITAAVVRARLQELRRVLEPKRAGRDIGGVTATRRAIVVSTIVGMSLSWVAAVASVRIVAATIVAMLMVTGPTTRAG
ncbi:MULTISPECIES: hypothetical protein [Mesorhizobium]|uniref:hypothetical protein n=1 Tax=Mesorhizobium TaxID=68287 RepID=UPI0003CDF3A3|nr:MULTISPECIES: hypothetical protein [Mesorhizobium]ESY64325.1 hypothetical protein X742_26500 [Mesorhizobium sp. LNHC232B00]WJI42179.1 hypothetical protein NL534_07160 [Mesorhizobium opportunistum]